MKPYILFFLVFLLFSTVSGKNNYIFEKISPPNGFAFSSITNIAEDDNGFIWFSTNRLYYYNNYEVKEYALSSDSISGETTLIHDIYNDGESNLWVCSDQGLFLFNEVEDNFVFQELTFDSPFSSGTSVESILFLKEDKYILSVDKHLYLYNKTRGLLEKFNPSDPFEAELENVSTLSIDNNNVLIGTEEGSVFLWDFEMSLFRKLFQSETYRVNAVCYINNHYYIGTEGNGVEVVDLKGNKINEYNSTLGGNNHLPDNRVRQIIERNQEVWIGTYRGLVIANSLRTVVVEPTEYNGLPHRSIYVLHKNKFNDVWIGTWSGGLVLYNEYNYRFFHIKKTHLASEEYSSLVCSFTEDKRGKIWVGNERYGVGLFDQTNLSFEDLTLNTDAAELTQVKSLVSSNGEEIWIGTFMKGLWKYSITSNELQQVGKEMFGADVIPNIFVRGKKLYICTRRNGLFIYDTQKGDFKQVSISSDYRANWIWKAHVEHQNAWLCTDLGLYKYDIENDSVIRYPMEGLAEESGNCIVFCAVGASDNELWVGTERNGLFKYYPVRNQIRKVEINEAIDHSDIYSIIQDQNSTLWLSTNNGIFSYDPNRNEVRQFSTIDGISGELFNPNATFQSSEGLLYFGSPNGFNIIDPLLVKQNAIVPQVYPAAIKVNNINLNSIEDTETNSMHLANLKNIELKHDDNSLAFKFVSNNFIKPEKNKYRYRLVNYQDYWAEVSFDQEITFTQVPPGNYTLEVFGSNNDNIWSNEPLLIQITINPPFWRTLYAFAIYLLLIASLAFLVIKQVMFRSKTRKVILDETYRREANELIHSEKQKFFTNISHEIRTPLTLILSPLQNLLKRYKYDESTHNHLHIIHRNANRLLKLTNQILDMRLIEVGKLHARIEKMDIVQLCKDVVDCFELQIIEKGINFIFRSNYQSFVVNADPDLIEKIIYNLVSNAVKYSKKDGQIIFTIKSKSLRRDHYQKAFWTGEQFTGDALQVVVKDFGLGIPKDKIPDIFERFSVNPDNENYGTGIGLNLCQEYTSLNKSSLFVTSKEGIGSRFTLNIPVEERAEFKKETNFIQPHFDHSVKDYSESESKERAQHDGTIILLVEDNDDLRVYLKNSLSSRYKMLSAKNGTQAFEIAQEVIPDLIITDILMPVMDGLELLSSIKNQHTTRHIPVIILTALTDTDRHIESLTKGAEAYLTKPIDDSVLIASIENILLKKRLVGDSPDRMEVDHSKKRYDGTGSFLEAAERVIEENLRNIEFGTKEMAEEMQISRSTLYRKIKHETSLNLTEFIRNKRLSHAIELIKSGKYNMNEIGYYVGFNSSSYFNRSFKKRYGMTPKEYSKKKG